MQQPETRVLLAGALEVRMVEGKRPVLRGYAAKFNTLSENLGGFREQISPGAFADVLGGDVRCLINHDANMILGRTASGSLTIGQDDTGLWYEAQLPETSYAADLAASVKRGDVSQSSFAFSIAPDGDSWAEDQETGGAIRTVTKIGRLYDVSAVTYPAYPDATCAVRSLDAFKERQAAEKAEADKAAARAAYQLRQAHRKRWLQLVESRRDEVPTATKP